MEAPVYVVLLVAVFHVTDAFVCRSCYHVSFLEECNGTIRCSPDESCYTQAVMDSDYKLHHNAGCSLNTVCSYINNTVSGKRQPLELVACHKCCSSGDLCNSNMCGLKSNPNITTTQAPTTQYLTTQATTTQARTAVTTVKPVITSLKTTTASSAFTPTPHSCYYCNDHSFGRVTDPRMCRNIVSCASDEMCTAEDFVDGTKKTFSFGCMNKDVCKLLTKFAIEDRYRCADPAIQAAGFCNRKRSSETSLCKVCCSGALCNLDTCEKLLDHMFMLWQNGVFDLSTLQQNGTLPTPSCTTF